MHYAPLRVPDVDAIRGCVRRFVERHPDAVLASCIDWSAMRWNRIPPAALDAHVERLVVSVEDPRPGREVAFMNDMAPAQRRVEPFLVLVGRESFTMFMTHAVGDVVSATRVIDALLCCDDDALGALEPRIGAPTIFKALAAEYASQPSQVGAFVRRRFAQRKSATDRKRAEPSNCLPVSEEPSSRPGSPFMTAVAHRPAVAAELRAWRDANLPGISVGSIVASVAYLALRDAGLNVRGDLLHTMIDARRYLPAQLRTRPGNLAKGIELSVDLVDPRSVAAAIAGAVAARVALPALAASIVYSARAARLMASPHPEPEALTLNLNWNPSDGHTSAVPWVTGRDAIMFAAGRTEYPFGITVNAYPVEKRIVLTASFHARCADLERVHAALESMGDVAGFLSRLSVTGPTRVS